MLYIMKIICISILIGFIPSFVFSIEIDHNVMQIEISTDKDVYIAGEEILLFVNMKNISEKDIIINKRWYSPNDNTLLIFDKNNRMLPPLHIWDRNPPTINSFATLKKNESYNEVFNLIDEEFDLTNPGPYKLQIDYTNMYKEYYSNDVNAKKIDDIDALTGNIKSNVIEIVIQ